MFLIPAGRFVVQKCFPAFLSNTRPLGFEPSSRVFEFCLSMLRVALCLVDSLSLARPERLIRNIHVPHPCGAALPSKNAFLHFCRTPLQSLRDWEFEFCHSMLRAALCFVVLFLLARPERFELPTTRFEAEYSIQLSYGRARSTLITKFYIPVNKRRVNLISG